MENRNILVVCPTGCTVPGSATTYRVRITRKWLEMPGFGAPRCPRCDTIMTEERTCPTRL